MLTGLSINNVILIDQLHLDLLPGFTSLTGETGAGKSILLDALSLALGHKADSDVIRMNTDQASIVATFSLQNFSKEHALFALLKEQHIQFDDELLLKRTLHRTQKGKAFINDQVISLALLKQIGEYLLHVHGQHDHLLNEALHKTLLDNFARVSIADFEANLVSTREAYNSWLQAHRTLIDFESTLEKLRDQELFYQEVLVDLNGIKIALGEEDRLIEQRNGLQQIGKVISTVEQTLKSLEVPTSWVASLYGFQKNLERCDADSILPLKNAMQAFERAAIEITEAQVELKSLFDADRTAARDLEEIDEQLHIIRNLARKYKMTSDSLCELYEEAKKASATVDDVLLERKKLERAVSDTLAVYSLAEKKLLNARRSAANQLIACVMQELPDLKLDRAVFDVKIRSSLKPSIDGGHEIAFWVSMNTGQESAPLAKTASGGEMARLMLVLKMILTKSTAMPTLIFDEIDTGVGGSVATAIGKKMHALGCHVQVLSITHSPQVAACSNHQWRIFKTEDAGMTRTHVTTLTHDDRVDEIARMLAGATLTDEARLAAARLMSE
ncbi:MAG: DNA repair protein RecN [Candidatus Paracaedibacteraceae bacterium]|nr:DNA repair protein RecN [Candidatus Paracaedibacteraceae bacterium]